MDTGLGTVCMTQTEFDLLYKRLDDISGMMLQVASDMSEVKGDVKEINQWRTDHDKDSDRRDREIDRLSSTVGKQGFIAAVISAVVAGIIFAARFE